jgi:DNA-binding beta-propeller fold protein YncE
MKKFITFSLFFFFTALISFAQLPTPVVLPNGWSLSPAGRQFPLGDLPLNIAVSHDGKKMAVTNNGQSIQSIQLIDPAAEKVLHTLVIPKAWYGLAFSDDDKSLYDLPPEFKSSLVLTSSLIGLNEDTANKAIDVLRNSR